MKLYRKMLSDADGMPLVGDGRNMLGVRPADPNQPKFASDVSAAIGSDRVFPGEGLSAYDDPDKIPPRVQGEMWAIETGDILASVVIYQRGKNPRHFQIEPQDELTLDEFQLLLAETRDLWVLEDGGGNS